MDLKKKNQQQKPMSAEAHNDEVYNQGYQHKKPSAHLPAIKR